MTVRRAETRVWWHVVSVLYAARGREIDVEKATDKSEGERARRVLYDEATTKRLRFEAGRQSHYYNLANVSDHRSYVGGAWEKIGKLQLDFLVQVGLRPSHKLLDLGCGALRGGVRYVKYLNANNYYGLDLSQHLLDAGYNKEIVPAHLNTKLPREHLVEAAGFEAADRFPGVKFDFVISVSVWTHLTIDSINACLAQVRKVLARGGAYYTTIFEPNSDADVGKANRHTPGNVVTYPRQDPFHYTISVIDELAQTNGLVLTHINHWNHPKAKRPAHAQNHVTPFIERHGASGLLIN